MKNVIKEFERLKNLYGFDDTVMVFLLDPIMNSRYGVTMRDVDYNDEDTVMVHQDELEYPYEKYNKKELLEGIEYTERMLYTLKWGFWDMYNRFSEYMIGRYSQYYPLYDGTHHMKLKSFNFVGDNDLKQLNLVCEIYLGDEKNYSIDLYNIGLLDMLTDYMKQGISYEMEFQGC